MPLYEFQCPSCHQVFEELFRNSAAAEAEPVACPSCGKAGANRLLSAPAAALNGEAGGASASGGGCVPRGGFT